MSVEIGQEKCTSVAPGKKWKGNECFLLMEDPTSWKLGNTSFCNTIMSASNCRAVFSKLFQPAAPLASR